MHWYIGPNNSLVMRSSVHKKRLEAGDEFFWYSNFIAGTPNASTFAVPKDCYDISSSPSLARAQMLGAIGRDAATRASRLSGKFDKQVNNAAAIEKINAQASSWTAGPNTRFDGLSVAEAQTLLGWNGITLDRKNLPTRVVADVGSLVTRTQTC